jgi:hypothetical protein
VAAIGVRGTDFVVNADSLSTRASVNEGVIVMAPFSDLCSVDGLGPCAANAVELAGNSLQVLEISGSAVLPSVQADQPSGQITDFQDRFQLAGSSAAGDREESDSSSAAVVYMETRGSDRVSEANVGLEFVDGSSASQGAQALLDYTPKAPFAVSNASDAQLVWGRFGNPGASDFLAVERSLAAEGRKVTIAASNYLLYRTEPNGARVDANIGVVGFDLKSAQAFYNYETGQVMMRVADGTLDVDFVNNRFFTTLQLDHAMTGLIDFSGNGRVADGGYLLGLDDSQSVVGAVATDAREAGYFFEASRLGGNVSGLTLWGGRR